MRFLLAIMLMLTITACGSNKDASTGAGELSKEEQEYVDLVLADDYESLKSATKGKDNDIQYDYNYLAQAFIKEKDLKDRFGEDLDIKIEFEVLIAYQNLESIIKYVDGFDYGNKDVNEKIDNLEKWAKKGQADLKDRYEKVAEKQKAYEEEMENLKKEAENK